MNRLVKTVFLCLAAMLADPTMAQSAPAQTLPGKSAPRMGILLGPPVLCTGTADCSVPVTVDRGTTTGSSDFCQVTLPSETKLGPQILKKIVWTLSPATIGNATYSFQPDYGILVLTDIGRQIFRSGLGDGVSLLDYKYYTYHLRSRKGDDVTYLPVVLQTVPSADAGGDPVVTLCGARDPKIVNDGA